jgi:hypothetical protein
MRSGEDVARVRELASYGLNHSQISRLTGVSRPAIRDWLRPESKRSSTPTCAVCGHEPHEFERLPQREYAYLLGVYLGDGTISRTRRRCFRLRIFMDSRYPDIIARKHERKIELAPWQQAIVEREPEAFIRALIHTDGCRVMNRVVVNGKDYAYSRYFFTGLEGHPGALLPEPATVKNRLHLLQSREGRRRAEVVAWPKEDRTLPS